MKRTLIFAILFLIQFFNILVVKAESVTIPKGTFFKAVNIRELSSAVLDEGETVSFLLSQPVYIRNINMFPENSLLNGYISKINEPVEGVNAAITIKFTDVTTPDNKKYNIKASIWSEGNDYFGGGRTSPKYYKKTPHYIKGIGKGWNSGVLQLTPTEYRNFGENLKVRSGAEVTVVLDEDFIFSY